MQGICKDCGMGTLNNDISQVFDFDEEQNRFYCIYCGNTHLDLIGGDFGDGE